MTLTQAILFSYAALFPIVNPIGASIIFLGLVKGASTQKINYLAFKIAMYSVVMLLFVLFIGSLILTIFGITVPIVLMTGGLLLAQVGWQMLNQPHDESSGHSAVLSHDKNINQIDMTDPRAFYPLTLPVTVGPTCIAITIALGAHSSGLIWEQKLQLMLGHSIGIILIGMTIFFCYRYSHYIIDKLKDAGRHVVMCLAAFLNICIGFQIIWHGISMLISGPH